MAMALIRNRVTERLHKLLPNASIIRCFSSSKLFIGGLSFTTDENSLKETFSPYGHVVEARVIFDRESSRSKGFGFVSYTSAEDASAAIQALDGRDLHGRFIRVAYASDQRRTSRGPSFSGAAGYGASNYGDAGVYNPYSNAGYGNHIHHGDKNYSDPNVGNYEGFSGNGNGGANYRVQGGLNLGPGCNFSSQDVSNGAVGGQYSNDVGANVVGGGASHGGFGTDSYGHTGNFGTNDYRNSSADSYSAAYGGADSSFNDRMPYNSSSWQNHEVEASSNFNAQDDIRGNVNDNGYANARYG